MVSQLILIRCTMTLGFLPIIRTGAVNRFYDFITLVLEIYILLILIPQRRQPMPFSKLTPILPRRGCVLEMCLILHLKVLLKSRGLWIPLVRLMEVEWLLFKRSVMFMSMAILFLQFMIFME